MELLEAINNILPYFGEAPITRIDNKHPTVAMITTVMQQVRKNLLAQGWWFNSRETTLYPDSDGHIQAPVSAVSIYSRDRMSIEIRGKLLYNVDEGTTIFKQGIKVCIHEDMQFQDLPRTAAYWVQCRTAMSTYAKDYGMQDILQQMQTREDEAYNQMLRQHLRKKRYSTMRSPVAHRYYSALEG